MRDPSENQRPTRKTMIATSGKREGMAKEDKTSGNKDKEPVRKISVNTDAGESKSRRIKETTTGEATGN